MKPAYLLAILLALPAAPASAQDLAGELVQGSERICYYPPRAAGTPERVYRVRSTQRCPRTLPFANSQAAPPPYASLEASSVSEGNRVCTYRQGAGRWSYQLPTAVRCPMTAGMIAQARADARTAAPRP